MPPPRASPRPKRASPRFSAPESARVRAPARPSECPRGTRASARPCTRVCARVDSPRGRVRRAFVGAQSRARSHTAPSLPVTCPPSLPPLQLQLSEGLSENLKAPAGTGIAPPDSRANRPKSIDVTRAACSQNPTNPKPETRNPRPGNPTAETLHATHAAHPCHMHTRVHSLNPQARPILHPRSHTVKHRSNLTPYPLPSTCNHPLSRHGGQMRF